MMFSTSRKPVRLQVRHRQASGAPAEPHSPRTEPHARGARPRRPEARPRQAERGRCMQGPREVGARLGLRSWACGGAGVLAGGAAGGSGSGRACLAVAYSRLALRGEGRPSRGRVGRESGAQGPAEAVGTSWFQAGIQGGRSGFCLHSRGLRDDEGCRVEDRRDSCGGGWPGPAEPRREVGVPGLQGSVPCATSWGPGEPAVTAPGGLTAVWGDTCASTLGRRAGAPWPRGGVGGAMALRGGAASCAAPQCPVSPPPSSPACASALASSPPHLEPRAHHHL